MQDCVLCNEVGGNLVCRNELFRVVLVEDQNYPGYVRLIVNSHVQEMTDLPVSDAERIFKTLLTIETIVREVYQPDKINLASLGNMVPHIHWHITPRYANDKHFPNPIFGAITNVGYVPDKKLFLLQDELSILLKQVL